MKKNLAAALAFLLLAGCISRPAPPPARLDLGPSLKLNAADSCPLILNAQAAPWLKSDAIVYRLAYDNPFELRAYGHHAWASEPAYLLASRLHERLAASCPFDGRKEPVQVDLWLAEATQVFSSPQKAQVEARLVVRARRSGMVASQKDFSASAPCPSPDAQGAAQAMARAADLLASQISSWLSRIPQDKKPL